MCPHFCSRINILVLDMQPKHSLHHRKFRLVGICKPGTSGKDVDSEAHLENKAPSALFNHTDKLLRRDLVQLHPSQVSFSKSHYVGEIGKQTGWEVIH